jgi:hypothetical protein
MVRMCKFPGRQSLPWLAVAFAGALIVSCGLGEDENDDIPCEGCVPDAPSPVAQPPSSGNQDGDRDPDGTGVSTSSTAGGFNGSGGRRDDGFGGGFGGLGFGGNGGSFGAGASSSFDQGGSFGAGRGGSGNTSSAFGGNTSSAFGGSAAFGGR